MTEDASGDVEELIRGGDLDALMLEVDRRCGARDWDGLVHLRDRCLAAIEVGRQLWGVAQFAEYRLALEGPGPYAAAVCRPDAGRFTLGPLTEVAASTHTWDELAEHLPTSWAAATVAQERVIRGEDLTGDPRARPEDADLPLVLQEWEPAYPLPRYRSHDLLEGGPAPLEDVDPVTVDATGDAESVEMPLLERAVREVTATWVEQSNGGSRLAVVRADAHDAVAALLPDGRVAPIAADAALERLAWAAASGGAYGRRRGMAAGRSSAAFVARAAGALDLDAGADELGTRLAELDWWHIAAPEGGWRLRLAVADAEGGWAAALDAWDRELEDEEGPGGI